MVKKYGVEDKHLGKRYDGGKSPLSTPVVLSVPEPARGVLDQSKTLHLGAPNQWNKNAQEDFDRVVSGYPPAVGGYIDKTLRGWGYDPARIGELRGGKKRKLINRMLREVRHLQDQMYESVRKQVAEFGAASLSPGYAPGGRVEFNGVNLRGDSERGELPDSFFRGERFFWQESPHRRDDDANRKARTALHVRLRQWASGPLKLEMPTGSSLHHLADYEGGNAGKTPDDVRRWFDDCQIVVVENDWGAAVPQIEGEWRVPFAFICWEFRISGVRVLAFTEADREPNLMWMCYGGDGHWVCDDYRYELGCPALPRGIAKADVDAKEFRAVAKMCYDTIRASCIMLDAQVAHHQHVSAPPKLVEKRIREGKAALRDHYVVRLLHNEQRAHVRARLASKAHAADLRSPQRGHWRKGTWVHYDDQDSGQVQYANDGGFMVSKTWRRWHFAGDPKNIIHKSYRL